jgi:hypothetical protein
MTDVHKALAELETIRSQIASVLEFRGYGPATLAATGLLAVLAAALQGMLIRQPARHPGTYLKLWVATAALSLALISLEAVSRVRRSQSALALPMLRSAGEEFLPAIVAGLLVTVVIWRGAPQDIWILPGLWQVLFSLGVFASCRLLPRPMFGAGLWYLASGLVLLAHASCPCTLSPWAMGIPFGIGQTVVAAVLWTAYREHHEIA